LLLKNYQKESQPVILPEIVGYLGYQLLMAKSLLFFCLLFCGVLQAQTYQLSGKLTNTKLEPLAFASIQIKNSGKGTISKTDGSYSLTLEEGRYELVYTMIGFVPQSITLVISKSTIQNIILEEETAINMEEVVVKGKAKDRAEEIMRMVIRNKENIQNAAGAYSTKLYIKAVQEDSLQRKKSKRELPDSLRAKQPNADLQRMAMAEILLQLDVDKEGRLKEERVGVTKWGNVSGLFYLSATEGDFNFYNNLVKVPAIATIPFLSPVSYSGLVAYKYKTLKVTHKGKYKEYTIAVKPRKMSNATVEGELTITDSAWAILHTRFRFPEYHLPEYDFFEVEQQYTTVDSAWMLNRQQFTYFTKSGKGKMSGTTTVTYADYVLNKTFGKKHFGVEVSATTAEAYKRDSLFWQTTRTEPLTEKELRFIRYKDSIYRATHTQAYLDSIDRITNKITFKKMALMGQTFFNREKERTWSLPPILALYQPIGFGGSRIQPSFFFAKISPTRRNLHLYTSLSYGIKNKDVNGRIRLTRMYNPFNRGFYSVSVGRNFDYIFSGDAWINMIKRSNYYLNNAVSVGHGLELANGLFFFSDVEVALRRSVSNYKTNYIVDSLLGDVLDNNQAIQFEPYNALYTKLRLQYTPGQRYIREPLEKVILGSAWPTFYTTWRKGLPGIANSKVAFDYLEFGMEQEIHAGLLGVSKYNIKTGSFLSKKDLRLVDYQFQRRGDPLLFLNPNEAFQSLDSTFPLFNRFYQAHFVHEFNGFFINKVPLLKKLGLREVGGGGFLIAPERNLRYAEAFAGVERAFKWPFNPVSRFKLGVYVVGSVANQFQNNVQFKIGITTWDKERNKWR